MADSADTGFTGTLTIKDTKYDVLHFSMGFGRSTDQKGRPNSRVMANGLSLVIEITEQTNLISLMIDASNEIIDTGTLEFTEAGKAGVRRKVVFENGFIASYSEGFQPSGSENFTCNVGITAEKIKIGTGKVAEYDAGWPVSS